MLSIAKPVAAARSTRQVATEVAWSVLAHGLVILAVALILHRSPRWVAPYRLPGSKDGHNFMVAYLPDRAPAQTAMAKVKNEPQPAEIQTPVTAPAPQKIRTAAAIATTPASPQPNSTTGADALGSGNIEIALTSYFPAPKPDLSALPHGTKGDVILLVVIDTDGRISDLKMMSGLGHGIDDTVISTVKQWTFHPALQDGRPVASEQELHFHYERG